MPSILHAALFVLPGFLLSVPVAHASPADSIHFCVPFDYEQWRREHPLPAAKVAADLNVGEPRTVRMIYFLPNDRPFREEVVDSIRVRIRQVQSFFVDEMESNGYGKLNLRIETGAQGEPLIHRVNGQYADSHYLDNTHVVYDEIDTAFDFERNIYVVVVDNSINAIGLGGGRRAGGTGGRRGKSGGNALVPGSLNFEVVAHELGHAWGLSHDFHDGTYIMSYGPGRRRLSACHAEFLAVHPYFNPNSAFEFEHKEQLPVVRLNSPSAFPSGRERVSIQVEAGDIDGLHQVLLFGRTMPPHFAAGSLEVKACRGLDGQRETTVEFEYDGSIPSALHSSLSDPVSHPISIAAIDREGNFRFSSHVLAETSPHQVATLEGHKSGVNSVVFSPRAPVLASGSWDRTITIWQTETSTPIAGLTGHESGVNSVAFSSDGATLASGSSDKTIRVWNLATRAEIGRLIGHEKGVRSVAFPASDKDILASGSDDGTVILWDLATRQPISTLEGHASGVNSVAFSPDNAILASGSRDGTVILWDVAAGEQTATLEGHASGVSAVAFSPDGAAIATGSWDDRVILWDVETRNQIGTLEGHRDNVNSVSFAAGGALLASGGRDGTVILWDVLTREKITTFGYPGEVLSVSFSASGALLAAGGRDGAVRLWEVSEWSGPRPFALEIISGDRQQGAAATELPQPLTVEIRDQHGVPLPDAGVTFTVTAGEGKLSGRFTVEHTTTDADGRAKLTLTLGPDPGSNIVGVSIGARELATFTATGVGTAVAELDGDYRTWHLPPAATVRLGKGALGQSDRAVALSADGRYVGVASNIGVWLYEATSSRALALLPAAGNVWSVAFSAGGILAAGSIGGTVELMDAATGTRVGTLRQGSGVTAAAFSPNGATIASSSLDGTIKLWNVETGEQAATLVGHTKRVNTVSFSPDGAMLASAGGKGNPTVRLWDVASQIQVAAFRDHESEVRSVSFSAPDGAILASASSRLVKLWDVAAREELATLDRKPGRVTSVAFLPDSAVLAAGSSDGAVRLWDVKARELITTLEWHTGEIRSISFSPDGSTLVSGAADGTVLLRDMATGNATAISGHGSFSTMALSPNGTLLASGEVASNLVTLWDTETQTRIVTLQGHESGVSDLTYSSDGALLASGSWDATVKLWNVAHRQLTGTLEGHTGGVTSVAFSTDGRTLASGSSSGAVRLWNVGNLEAIGIVQGHKERVTSLAFSDDGRTLASGSSDRSVRIWEVASGKEIATLEGHTNWITSVSFLPDKSTLASGSRDRTVRLWDVTTKAPIAAFEAGSPVYSVAYSPDGTLLVAGSYGAATIWEIKTREQIATLQGHLSSIHSVGFFRDGATLATGSSDGTILLWDLQRLQSRPHTLRPFSGLEQQRPAGSALAEPFVVLVLDQNGDPVAGATVVFTVTAGGGELSVATATTDENGRATTTLTLGSQPGANIVVATVADLDPVTFTATARAASDFDGDGTVGFSDFVQFAAKFGLSKGNEGYDVRYDLDENGAIGFSDFLIFANAFGNSTGSA